MNRSVYDLYRYYARKQEAIDFLGGKCVDCGTTEMLEFDHIDPSTKLYNIGMIMLHGDDKLYKELKKCVLRCHTCHKLRSDTQQSIDHGGGLSGKRNCKCIPCKARKAEYMRYYKKYGARRK